MASLIGFDANKVDPNANSPLPEGDYICKIVESGEKTSKASGDKYINLKITVLDGPCKGRTLYHMLCLWSKNETAKRIAEAHLSQICRAIGVMTPKDTAELHNMPIIVHVTVTKDQQRGEMRNNITKFEKRKTSFTSETKPSTFEPGNASSIAQDDPETNPWNQ